MSVQENRPPYVDFERRAVEDRAKSLAEGVYVTKDVDFIVLIPAGSAGKTSIEQPYTDWLARTKPRSGGQGAYDGHYTVEDRFPAIWLEKIERQYDLWKKGEYMEVEGTPLKTWPVISPAQMKICTDMHILSVEMLANAGDESIERMGLGAVALRERARSWIKEKAGQASSVGAELEKTQQALKSEQTRRESLEEQVKALQTQVQMLLTKKAA